MGSKTNVTQISLILADLMSFTPRISAQIGKLFLQGSFFTLTPEYEVWGVTAFNLLYADFADSP